MHARPRAAARTRHRALALALALLALLATACRDEDNAAIDVGALDSFTPRTATSFTLIKGERAVRHGDVVPPEAYTFTDPRLDFFITRSATGELTALLAVDPTSACPLGTGTQAGLEAVAFRDRCFNSTYDLLGHHLAGPVPRDIPRLPARVERGRVLVLASLDALTNTDGAPYRRGLPPPARPHPVIPASALAPGEVRSFILLQDGSFLRYAVDGSVAPPGDDVARPVLPRVAFHIARPGHGPLLAIYPTAAVARRCDVEWYLAAFEDRDAFREGCGGTYFDIEGRRLFGPAARDLDRLPLEIRDGTIFVTASRAALIRSTPVPRGSSDPNVTPTRVATPPAP